MYLWCEEGSELNENEERETFRCCSDMHPPILDIMSGLNWMCGLNTDICTNIAPAIGWRSGNYCDYVENSVAAAVGMSHSPAQSAALITEKWPVAAFPQCLPKFCCRGRAVWVFSGQR